MKKRLKKFWDRLVRFVNTLPVRLLERQGFVVMSKGQFLLTERVLDDTIKTLDRLSHHGRKRVPESWKSAKRALDQMQWFFRSAHPEKKEG